nr:hypothetical protein [Tanacetum cinerariifolium]
MPGGIGSSGLKYKSISSIRGSPSLLGIGDGEKDSISALEMSETISSGGQGDELSYNNLWNSVEMLVPHTERVNGFSRCGCRIRRKFRNNTIVQRVISFLVIVIIVANGKLPALSFNRLHFFKLLF